MGYVLKGLGSYEGRAKRLIEKELDGFQTGDPEENELYNFYQERIEEIKNFFIRNKNKIEKINEQFKGNNLSDIEYTLREITEDIINTGRKYESEGIIETTWRSETPITQNSNQNNIVYGIKERNLGNEIINTDYPYQNNMSKNYNNNFNKQFENMDPEQFAWFSRLQREQNEDKIQEKKIQYQIKNNNIEEIKEEGTEPLMNGFC